jgi:hypothetical protein
LKRGNLREEVRGSGGQSENGATGDGDHASELIT